MQGVERETGEGFHVTLDWLYCEKCSFEAMWSCRDTVTDIRKHTTSLLRISRGTYVCHFDIQLI